MFSYNQTLFELENPNKPFGGYGICSGYVSIKGEVISKPILISQEVKLFLQSKKLLYV